MTIISKTIHEKIIIFFWRMMAGVVLFSAFSGCLWGFMIFKPPAQKINSWLDLHKDWKEMKIISMENGLMADFENEKSSDMVRDFANRIEIYPTESFLNLKLRDALMLKTLKENYVIVFEYYNLKYLSFNSKPVVEMREKKGFKKGTEFHVSETGGGSLPYFLFVKNDKNNFTATLDRT